MGSMVRRAFLALLLIACGGRAAMAQNVDLDEITAGKRARAVRITEPIRLDGILDDAAWKLAEPLVDFYQQYPDEFAPATRTTEVRFLYDDRMLYVGAMLYDDRPNQLITNELKRDFSGFDSDSFTLLLDTFLDRQNAYGFLTNPGGAMRDTLSSESGRRIDANWEGVWTARTAVLPNGWSLEYAIPFKTLRFPTHESQEWGLNISRVSRRINERSTWAPVPRHLSYYHVGYAGTLSGISGVRPGHNLYVKPFATSQIRGEALRETEATGDGGLDLKWGITPSLLLDGSWRTDFSQVEADEQQINLTRFSLFFPEKREFFLEGPSNFQIGLEERLSPRRDILPFFSRRIGLSSGQPVPVVGGVRLTGQLGAQNVGMLNMQTESFDGNPGDNFTSIVIRRPLSPTTSLGGFYFGREASGSAGFNRVTGFDFRFSPRRTFGAEAFAMRSGTSGRPSDWAGRVGFLLDSSRHYARLGFLHIGDSFQNDLGYVRRSGIGTLFGRYARIIRPNEAHGRVSEHTLGASFEATADDRYTQMLTRIGGVNYSLLFTDGGLFTASMNSTFERLDTAFRIGPTLLVAPGEYRFDDARVGYTSNRSAVLSGSVEVQSGTFWTGHQRTLDAGLRIRVNAHLAARVTAGRSLVTLPEESFTGDLVGLRIDTSFTPRMFLNAFIQYNGETDTWLSNIRYNLIHRPLSDIYVVWNETRFAGDTRRALMLKYTHLIPF